MVSWNRRIAIDDNDSLVAFDEGRFESDRVDREDGCVRVIHKDGSGRVVEDVRDLSEMRSESFWHEMGEQGSWDVSK